MSKPKLVPRWFDSEDEIAQANRHGGHHWFDSDTKRFFGSRILGPVRAGHVLVTSEYSGFDRAGRLYTVRAFDAKGRPMDIPGEEFLQHKTSAAAHRAARRIAETFETREQYKARERRNRKRREARAAARG